MASSLAAGAGPAAAARRSAAQILSESRFRRAPVPRPLHGVLKDIGNFLESPLNAIGELVSEIGDHVPGGESLVWAVLAAVLLATVALLAGHGARRALRAPQEGTRGSGEAPPSAAQLEREAERAEREARYADAVRLRFRAGLMRLAERDLVADAPDMLNGEVAHELHSRSFDALAGRFDEIAYGGAQAGEADAEFSRREWRSVLGSARTR